MFSILLPAYYYQHKDPQEGEWVQSGFGGYVEGWLSSRGYSRRAYCVFSTKSFISDFYMYIEREKDVFQAAISPDSSKLYIFSKVNQLLRKFKVYIKTIKYFK